MKAGQRLTREHKEWQQAFCEKCGKEMEIYKVPYKDRETQKPTGNYFIKAICEECHFYRHLKRKSKDVRLSTHYQHIKNNLIENAKCRICDKQNELEVHHIIPMQTIKKHKELEKYGIDERNLIVVCKSCHKLIHEAERELRESL